MLLVIPAVIVLAPLQATGCCISCAAAREANKDCELPGFDYSSDDPSAALFPALTPTDPGPEPVQALSSPPCRNDKEKQLIASSPLPIRPSSHCSVPPNPFLASSPGRHQNSVNRCPNLNTQSVTASDTTQPLASLTRRQHLPGPRTYPGLRDTCQTGWSLLLRP